MCFLWMCLIVIVVHLFSVILLVVVQVVFFLNFFVDVCLIVVMIHVFSADSSCDMFVFCESLTDIIYDRCFL